MLEKPAALKDLLTILDDNQVIDTITIDVSQQTSVTDFMIITSGRSSRHVKATALNVLEKMKKLHHLALGSHGLENGDWALIDFGDLVLHVMQPETRLYYNLEKLWQDNNLLK